MNQKNQQKEIITDISNMPSIDKEPSCQTSSENKANSLDQNSWSNVINSSYSCTHLRSANPSQYSAQGSFNGTSDILNNQSLVSVNWRIPDENLLHDVSSQM